MRYFKKVMILFIFTLALAINACRQAPETKPNILWIYLEDTSPLLSCYGASIVSIPI